MEQSGRDGFKDDTVFDDNSSLSDLDATDMSGVLPPNSSTFEEFNALFDNVALVFNGSEIQETPAFKTTYNCQLYRFIMSVGLTGSLCVFGILGNILTLLVFSKFNRNSSDKKSRSSAPLLLSGLAISDFSLLFTLFIVKSIPSFVSFTKIYPNFFVTYFFAFLMVYGWPCVGISQSINSWITVLVAMHRFIAILLPHKAAVHCTYKKARIHLIAVCIIVAMYELPTFFNNKISKYVNSDNKTIFFPTYAKFNVNHWYKLIYKTTLYYIINYLIPWVILAIVTVFLVRAVKQAQKFRSQMGTNSDNLDNTEDITRSLIAVVITSLVCRPWEPMRRVIEAIVGSKPGCGHYYYYYEEFPSLTAALNSSANFVLYCLFAKRFPETLREMLRIGRSSQSDAEMSASTVVSDVATEPKIK